MVIVIEYEVKGADLLRVLVFIFIRVVAIFVHFVSACI
jgi:hypothetical protein